MKTLVATLLIVLISITAFAQEGSFLYKDSENGIEILFPSKPFENSFDNQYISQKNANFTIYSAGISYTLIIQKSKSSIDVDLVKTLSETLKPIIVDSYSIDNMKVIEFETNTGGCVRSKIIKYGKMSIWLMVASNTRPVDKDVFPFFNSLKIGEELIVKNDVDLSNYNKYSIHTTSKIDTIKQVVYINKDSRSKYQFESLSDVDKNIPRGGVTNSNRYALIVGNEDYSSFQIDLSSEVNVDFARNDASAFKEYAIKTLGIPEKNIIFLLDATKGQMSQGISKINLIVKNTNGQAEVILYYAGHGVPNEQTKEACIMPVDISAKNVSEGIKLKDLYAKLLEFPSKRVSIFIDACFSGGARGQGLLAARGVRVKPKEDILKGNLVVFTASSGEQSSLPYKEQKHGLFTYYLLKKIQDSKGEVSYKELADYIKSKVALQSVLVNDKEQTPQVNTSCLVSKEWERYKIRY